MLADQSNQTTNYFNYVVNAAADPNVLAGDAYYEKLTASTTTLSTDYRLLSDTEVEIIRDSNSYRVFRIQAIQDDGTPLTSVNGGRISFEYSGANVTAILFNQRYTDAILEFYGKDVNVRFYNRSTRVYQTEAVASTAWTTVNTNYYRAAVTGTNIQIADLSVNNRVEFFIVEGTSSAGGGALEYQTAITANTTLDGTQKGLNKVYPVNNTAARTITVTTGDYVENDVINIERRGQGSVEIIADTGVFIRGVRNSENRYFINDVNGIVALLCRGSEEFGIIGDLSRGYSGAVTTSSYTSLQPTETANVTVIGTGFSSNMKDPAITGNATLNSWVFVDGTEITLNITSSGIDTDTLDITYDNGDIFIDVNAITLTTDDTLYGTHPFPIGYATFKLKESQVYGVRVRRSTDSAEVDVEFNASGKIALDSAISTGGDLTTWVASNDAFIVKKYNQGSLGTSYDLIQATTTKQVKLVNAGSLVANGGLFDGTDDVYETTSLADWRAGSFSIFSHVNATSLQNGLIFSAYTSVANRPFLLRVQNASSRIQFNAANTAGTLATTGAVSASISISTDYKIFAYDDTANLQVYLNGTAGTSDTSPTAYTGTSALQQGQTGDTNWALDGSSAYAVYYDSDKSADRVAMQVLIDNYYLWF